METLYDLVKLNHRNKRIIDALIPSDENSPLKKLSNKVFSNTSINDYECMLEIYGKKKVVAFSRLKARLKEILYQAILLQNSQSDKDETRVYDGYIGFKHTAVAKSLAGLKSNRLAVELLEKSILKSIKYHATENVILQSRMLIFYYGSTNYNKYKFTKYSLLQEKYIRIYHWEIKAENYFFDLQRTTIQSFANPGDETKRKAYKYAQELQEIHDIKTESFLYNRFRVMAAYFEYEKNYSSLLELSENTLSQFNLPEYTSTIARTNISLRRMWALIQAGRISETVAIGLKEQNKLQSGSVTWYRISYYTLKGLLYQGEYKKAINLISILFNHNNFPKISENYIEIFNTILGYIHLIVDSGVAGDSKELQKKLPEFKLGKFLNTTPVFSKDKRGINVSILLMHIAFLLLRKDFNAIIDRIDSLNQYAYRYLRRDDSFRSNCMIKMVIQMTKADFHPVRTARYTEDLRNQLSQVSLSGSGENIEVEIIPFEVLWNIMNKALVA